MDPWGQGVILTRLPGWTRLEPKTGKESPNLRRPEMDAKAEIEPENIFAKKWLNEITLQNETKKSTKPGEK